MWQLKTDTLLLTVFLGSLSATAGVFGANCTFPDFVQNDPDNSFDAWASHVRLGQDMQTIKVVDGVLTSTAPLRSTQNTTDLSFNCSCISDEENNTFIVDHMQDGNVTYMCMQFVQRNSNVLQVKTGNRTTNRSEVVCSDETLILDEWPWVAFTPKKIDWVYCPVHGGFRFLAYDNYAKEPICQNFPVSSRLESECMKGEGIRFTFPDRSCIPDKTGWNLEQTLYCVANWVDSNYTYVIVKQDGYIPGWCMRWPLQVPDVSTTPLNIQIYQDLICPSSIPPTGTRYVSLAAKRSASGACVDEADTVVCEGVLLKDQCRFQLYADECRKTCGLCVSGEDAPEACLMNKEFAGSWTEQLSGLTKTVTVGEKGMQISTFDNFTCMETVDSKTVIMRTDYSTGCRSRFTCSKFNKINNSTLQYHLGQSESRISQGDHSACTTDRFQDDPFPLADTYRSRFMKNTILRSQSLSAILCDLGGNFTLTGRNFKDNDCSGDLSDSSSCIGGSTLRIKLTCGNDSHLEEKLTCLSRFSSPDGATFLIAGGVSTAGSHNASFFCWVRRGDHVYFLPSPQCHAGTESDITLGKVIPLYNLTMTKRPDECGDSTTPAVNVTTSNGTGSTQPSTSASDSSVTTLSTSPNTDGTSGTTEPSSTTTTSQPTTTDNSKGSGSNPSAGLSGGAIAGIVFGVLLVVGVLLFLAFTRFKKRMRAMRQERYSVF